MKFEPSAVPFYYVHRFDLLRDPNYYTIGSEYDAVVLASDYRALLLRYNLALSLLETESVEPTGDEKVLK